MREWSREDKMAMLWLAGAIATAMAFAAPWIVSRL